MATVDQSSIRGLVTAGALFVAAFLKLGTGVGAEPAQRAFEVCLTRAPPPAKRGDGCLPMAEPEPSPCRSPR